MLDFTIELHRTNDLLERVAVALERLAGPVPEVPRPIEQAQLTDYSTLTPEQIDEIKDAETWFATTEMVVPGSEEFMVRVSEFERVLVAASGPEALETLPWRKRH